MTRPMRFSFRAKLTLLVTIAATAFLLLLGAGALIDRRVEREVTTIRDRYLPKIALGPELQAQFERMQRGFQDAVTIRDRDALAATKGLRTKFLDRVAAAGPAVEPDDAVELRAALDEYFDAATDVSRRLIADETGEHVVEAIAAMQAKQARFAALLERSTAFDQVGLAAAFDAVFRADRAAQRYRFWIVVACLVTVTGVTGWISRNVLRSVFEIEAGFRRFGKGEFAQPIPSTTNDEIGDLARQANEMAASLERQITARVEVEKALTLSNHELEAFSYSVAHDLRAPLRGISGFSTALLEDFGDKLDDDAKGYLNRITAAAERMSVLIDALLSLSRVTRGELRREEVNLTRLVEAVVQRLRASDPSRDVELTVAEGVSAWGDPGLLAAVFENLLSNAWKFTGAKTHAKITFGVERKDGSLVYFVKDNGAGFSMEHANKLFAPFQRLHSSDRFAGTGIGLATVQRIIARHGGRIWAESEEEKGATFYFTVLDRGTRPPS